MLCSSYSAAHVNFPSSICCSIVVSFWLLLSTNQYKITSLYFTHLIPEPFFGWIVIGNKSWFGTAVIIPIIIIIEMLKKRFAYWINSNIFFIILNASLRVCLRLVSSRSQSGTMIISIIRRRIKLISWMGNEGSTVRAIINSFMCYLHYIIGVRLLFYFVGHIMKQFPILLWPFFIHLPEWEIENSVCKHVW